MMVTFAAERAGNVRAWVVKHESHASKQIKKALSPDAVVFSDSAAGWNDLRGQNKLLQVNHKICYSSPEACTNNAESAVNFLRHVEDVHRHITSTYLDLYASDAAWRKSYNRARGRKSERLEALMSAMSRSGKSPLTGYFEGRKRLCRIVDHLGQEGTWRPPTREERDNKRKARGGTPPIGPYRPKRTAENWHRNFEFISAAEFAHDRSKVRDTPGVYLLCLPKAALIERLTELPPEDRAASWSYGDFVHVYTGESYGLQSRLREHLTGEIDASTFRESLMALRWFSGASEPTESFKDRSLAERALTDWLVANALIGYKTSPHIKDYERDILTFTTSPLNLMRDNPTEFTRRLKSVRREFRQAVVSTWEPPARAERRYRR